MGSLFRWFGHVSDPFAPISDGTIWLHDLTQTPGFNCVVPLITEEQVMTYPHREMLGVCSDFIYLCKQRFIEPPRKPTPTFIGGGISREPIL